MKNATKLIAIFVLLAVCAFGQTALSTTTLSAALTSTATTVTLTSTSTMQNQGAANQINTCIYVDFELMGVITVVDSTHVTVSRRGGTCGSTGASARPVSHASGAKVYFSITSGATPAPSYFAGNTQQNGEISGSCTASSLLYLPVIYPSTGDIKDCKRTGAAGTSGQWIVVGHGSMMPSGQRVSAFCTGTVGSAETEFLNGATCSGATTATARQLITSPGTLTNFYIVSSANSLGTGGTAATVVLNGTATALTCSIAAAAKVCSDTTHSVAVVPGDVITFSYLTSTSDTAANIGAAVSEY